MVNQSIREAVLMAKMGDVQGISQWMEAGNNPNAYDDEGWTPLLWACARGNSDVVRRLLDGGADSLMGHQVSEALPIHLAGHSGDVTTAAVLLEKHPDEINLVWDLNGHTILLQASFYGHLDLADYLVKLGADTSITTARGLGPMEMARQFQNHEMMAIIEPYDASAEKKASYYKTYLERIAQQVPDSEKKIQAVTDALVTTIEKGIRSCIMTPDFNKDILGEVRRLVEQEGADVNRLAGPLSQPSLVVTVTGNNGLPTVEKAKQLRNDIARYLLEQGADPTKHENHPMGAQTIIRGAVFNHLEILRMCADHITSDQLTDAINEIPVVNGLTALHDTVLRATMADEDKFEGYLEQCKWFMDNGGKSDIEDFAGVTQKNIAENCQKEMYRTRLLEIL